MKRRHVPPPDTKRALGGWLLLLALAFVALPIRLLLFIWEDLLPAFSREAWPLLTTPGSPAYHPLNKPILLFELIGNSLTLLGALVVASLFFLRHRRFPLLGVVFLALAVAFYVADYFITRQLPLVAEQSGSESKLDLIGALLVGVAVSTYLLVSKRVKETFVR
ncbi:MAG: DUF2569 domain-containing protein [Nitrospirota bacterium]